MLYKLQSAVKRIVPVRYHRTVVNLRNRITGCYVESYSQQGEDAILRILFNRVQKGFYVDVGAFHPLQFSNTYYFYKRGWRGINIDATPGVVSQFNRLRPRDINLEAAVAAQSMEATFFMYRDADVNTLSTKNVDLQSEECSREVVSSKKVRTRTLGEILDANMPPEQRLDFLSVDVEGYDLEVLQSNRWERYLPKVVLCEDLSINTIEDVGKSGVYNFLRGKGYGLFSKCFHTMIFAHESFRVGG